MAGTNTELAGEVPSPFLSARVKVRKQRTQIAELTVGGTTVPDAQGILKAATQYYTDLFGADGRTSSERWKPLPGKRLNAEAAEMLEADWTEQEVKQAFKALANNKLPGKDGLPKELFERNWDILGGEFLRMAQNFSDTASIPASIKEAVTILLHKKGDKDKLDNYRPITLLNFTYKVLARVVANRMRPLLHRVISEEQYGFIPGRRISDAIGVVADVIEAAKKGDEDWYLLLVDFRKAFDSVSRSFIFTVLREMGFPERFVGWVEGLHRETKTRLLVNGWLGEAVDVKSGVRQGCPLAPYLFQCAVEPLAQEACRRKLGLCNKAGQRLVYLGYADDTTLFLEGKRQIARAEKLLDYLAQLSGLATNRDKSVVMPLGHNLGRRPGTLGGFKWAKADEAERLLGVWVTPSGSSAPTWQRAFEKITVELIKWKALFLTIAARVVIINCYITPRIAYQAQVYPPPENVWKQLLKLMHNFLSGNNASADGSYFLWSWDLLSTPRVDGGLGVLDPDILLACLAARRIGGLLLEGNGKKKEVMLTAAGLPMGNDTFVAHEKLLKHWPGSGGAAAVGAGSGGASSVGAGGNGCGDAGSGGARSAGSRVAATATTAAATVVVAVCDCLLPSWSSLPFNRQSSYLLLTTASPGPISGSFSSSFSVVFPSFLDLSLVSSAWPRRPLCAHPSSHVPRFYSMGLCSLPRRVGPPVLLSTS
ncbi:unnamed protein product [Closterium sp. NIES-53]